MFKIYFINMLLEVDTVVRLIGGTFLCYWGVKTFVSIPAQDAAPAKNSFLSAPSAYFAVQKFFLTPETQSTQS